MVDEIAKAFFEISQGHPLHLIYAYESLIHAGGATSADEVQELPSCPDGDIRTYYQGLWIQLSASAKNALHMLAGSDFFWPRLGIRQVLGDFSEIDFLLEARNSGMVPFHPSPLRVGSRAVRSCRMLSGASSENRSFGLRMMPPNIGVGDGFGSPGREMATTQI